jgi:hypothetical protein
LVHRIEALDSLDSGPVEPTATYGEGSQRNAIGTATATTDYLMSVHLSVDCTVPVLLYVLRRNVTDGTDDGRYLMARSCRALRGACACGG